MLVLAMAVCNAAQADIYKWRGAGGVTQYADRLPTDAMPKVSHAEIMSALQASTVKNYCSLLTTKKTIIAKTSYTDFFGTVNTNATTIGNKNGHSGTKTGGFHFRNA